MNIKTYLTAGIAEKAKKNSDFYQFIATCIKRHLSGDWGDTCAEDARMNDKNPLEAMSAYTSPDGVKIWIKQDYNVLTVLFPSEY